MKHTVRIGIVGDRNDTITAHRALPLALRAVSDELRVDVRFEWRATESIEGPGRVADCDGLWCVPGSPYRSMDGALCAIRHARVQGVPFLGTCGGFQHALVEYARGVLGWADADHAESSPGAERAVVAPLACALVEVTNTLRLAPGSKLAAAYGALTTVEGYHCSYGLNPRFREALTAGPLRAVAADESGEVRAVELDGHPFFVGTLFQPERAALAGRTPPPVLAFVAAAAGAPGH